MSSELRFMPPHPQTQALTTLLPPFSAWAKNPRNISRHEPYCTKESKQHTLGFAEPGSPYPQQAIVQWQELRVAGLSLPSTSVLLWVSCKTSFALQWGTPTAKPGHAGGSRAWVCQGIFDLGTGCGVACHCHKTHVSGATHGAGRRYGCCGCCFPWQRHCLFVCPPYCLCTGTTQGATGLSWGELPSFSHGHKNQPWGCRIWALLVSCGQERLLRAATSMLDGVFAALDDRDQMETWWKRAEVTWWELCLFTPRLNSALGCLFLLLNRIAMLSPNIVTRSAWGEGLVQHSRCLSVFFFLAFFLFPKLNLLFKLSPEAWKKAWTCFTNPSPLPKHLSVTYYK